jgi:hypothetical protein
MKYRTLPEVVFCNNMPIIMHNVQEKRWIGWRNIARVLTVEQAEATIKALEESNKKKG